MEHERPDVRRRASLDGIAAAAPAGRDRYVDFLRVFSIGVVVLGHWLIAVVGWRGGRVEGANALALVPGLWAATWLLQVMPVFFFIGGFSNLVSIDSVRRKGGDYASFLDGRLARLMRPTTVFLAVWLAVAAILEIATPVPKDVLHTATQLVGQPLWFLGIYLLVVALSPAMLELHRRFRALVPLAMVVAAVAIDVARLGLGFGTVGYLNYGVVWLFAHQLGFFYADGTLPQARRGLFVALAGAGLGSLVILTNLGIYPRSVVGLPGDRVSNMTPPTLCIVALTVWLVGLVMLLRPVGSRWLARPRVWASVIGVNAVVMTMFLWHLTAMLIAVVVLFPLGFPQPPPGSALWWLVRPVWIAVLALILLPLVTFFGRFERPGIRAGVGAGAGDGAGPAPGREIAAALGATYVILGMLGFAVSGFDSFAGQAGATLVLLSVNPLQNALHLVIGVLLLREARARRAPRLAPAGAALALLGVVGLLLAGREGLNILALGHTGNGLHLATAAVALAAGLTWRRAARPHS